MSFTVGEIDRETGILGHVGRDQPFLPAFPPGFPKIAVDLTGLDPTPEPGWVWLGGREFAPPQEDGDGGAEPQAPGEDGE
jgi:hypothetical protein